HDDSFTVARGGTWERIIMRRKSMPDKFPLRLHITGQWMKKIRGRSHYFGTDRDKALAENVRPKDDLEGGRLRIAGAGEPHRIGDDGRRVLLGSAKETQEV